MGHEGSSVLDGIAVFIADLLNAREYTDYIGYIVTGFALLILFVILRSLFSLLSRYVAPLRSFLDRLSQGDARQKKAVMKKIRKLIDENGLKEAADLYVSIDEPRPAAKLYEDCGAYAEAAGLHEALGDLKKAAELYKKAGKNSTAAELFEKTGDIAAAASHYEAAGLALKAAELCERSGNNMKAAELFERCALEEGTRKAGSRAGDYSLRSGRLYEKAGRKDLAIRAYMRAELNAEAAPLYESTGDLQKAAECYLKSDDFEKAAELFRKGGDLKRGGEILSRAAYRKGNVIDAARYAEEAGDLAGAAEMYREAGEFAKAARLYGSAGWFVDSGEMYVKEGDFGPASEAFAKGGKYLWAAEAADKAGTSGEPVAELYEKAEEYLESGKRYLDLGLPEKALSVLQKVGPDSDDYMAASVLIGGIFLDGGMLKLAREKFQKIIGSSPPGRANLDAFYYLALCCERSGEIGNAREIYDRILAEDYQFKDVAVRIEGLRDLPQSRPQAAEKSEDEEKQRRYELMEEIGRGGMGIVYKAKDTLLDRVVAYKVLPQALVSNPLHLEKFLKEARISAGLNHPNIVTIFDTGREGDSYYITMEFIEGKTIKEFLDAKKSFRVTDVLMLARQICRGLAYAHNKKIVHRDIKPANIMVNRQGGIKIMDFGIAKVMEELTQEITSISGTPTYMSPEQIRGKDIDNQTDIYALGVMLFHLSTGRLPFVEGDQMYHHLHTAPPSPKEIDPSLPDGICRIILKCIEKDKTKRYRKAEEILADIEKMAPTRKA